MKLKTLALMGICAGLVLTACNKDDDKDDGTKTTGSTSIEGTWKLSGQTFTTSFGGVDSTEDEYASMEPCEKDDLVKFNTDKTMMEMPGATKCDPSEPNSELVGIWALTNNNTKLQVIAGDTMVADIVTLNATTLSVKFADSYMGISYVQKMTYTRQ